MNNFSDESTERLIRIDERVEQIQIHLVSNEEWRIETDKKLASLEAFKWKAIGALSVVTLFAPKLLKMAGAL